MERYLLETCYLLTRDLYQIFITFFAMSFMLKPRYHRAICVSASVLYSFASEQLLIRRPTAAARRRDRAVVFPAGAVLV